MEARRYWLVIACSTLLGGSAWALEGDPARAEKHLSACIGCHGIAGYRTAFPTVYSVPKLGGQHEAYLVSALKAYRDGGRSHPSMQAIAASLSDQDMADLAAYYARGGQ